MAQQPRDCQTARGDGQARRDHLASVKARRHSAGASPPATRVPPISVPAPPRGCGSRSRSCSRWRLLGAIGAHGTWAAAERAAGERSASRCAGSAATPTVREYSSQDYRRYTRRRAEARAQRTSASHATRSGPRRPPTRRTAQWPEPPRTRPTPTAPTSASRPSSGSPPTSCAATWSRRQLRGQARRTAR